MGFGQLQISKLKWFCHFDDDNYVNVPRLLSVLQRFNYKEDWYLGRTSVSKPLKAYFRRDKPNANQLYRIKFWFGTGGAGICISRGLALKMLPIASGGRFASVCKEASFPDDVSMGFIMEIMMRRNLTVMKEFHSHLEPMKLLATDTLKDQVSFGYSKNQNEWNVVNVPGFDTRYDPTRSSLETTSTSDKNVAKV
ncbi:hypothetical protein MSG28_003573 [Choristoneura fumiferana]|uniref:Uncharacterized protein n=1 Tax=Choristoneura fumiferana TaxID=7141 RepID=A0ACC0KFC2_CHOFU|nr:hypothetical protein MSG28_003573 [Choristoneura fumiferana]